MTRPVVLLIDDEPRSAALPDSVEALIANPADESFGADLQSGLAKAHMILLDQNLHQTPNLTLSALDGAGLVGNLRSWGRANDLPLPPIVIYSNDANAFADEVPSVGPAVPLAGTFVGREYRIAPSLDVEWLILKDDDLSLAHIAALAQDCVDLQIVAKDGRMSLAEIADFMRLPKNVPWSVIATAHLAKWRPPINEAGDLGTGSRGSTPVLRWLLHRVIPCAGLLLSDLSAAWSLGIHPDDFSTLCERREREWAAGILAATFTGAGKGVNSRRWWAAGIDHAGWLLREKAYSLGSLQAALNELGGEGIRLLDNSETVVAVNLDLEEDGVIDIAEAIQVRPPGWPHEAADPWMRRNEVASDPAAFTMVAPDEAALVQ